MNLQTNQQLIKGKLEVPISLNIRVGVHNSKPCVEVRKVITDTELIKIIINSAFNEKTLITQPIFINKLNAVASLIDKGILYRKENKYYFLF